MDEMFGEGMEEFVLYEKDLSQKKTKHQKKQQKLTKLRDNLKDPEMRKERYLARREQEKAKLKKEIEGLSYEEATKFIKEKQKLKKARKEKALKALETGMPILIDMVYEQRMNEKQNKSLATQIELIMTALKRMDDPPGIHLCSVAGGALEQLQRMRYEFWTLKSNAEDVVEVAKSLNKNPVYLSPDAPDQLTEIDPNAAYIIGGLVDRTVIKNASLNRAEELGIPAVSLPIRDFMKNRACLNLDHVVMILNRYQETGNWKQSFDYGAPKRWKRDEKEESKKQGQKKQETQKAKEEKDQEEQ